MDDLTFKILTGIVLTLIGGIIAYAFRKIDATPSSKEFDSVIQRLEVLISGNKESVSELKQSNKELLNRWDDSIKRVHDKLDEIRDKMNA